MKQRIFLSSLTGGVSRQPQTQRLLNQVEQADNVTMAMARGLQKRPGTKAIAYLSGIAEQDIVDQCVIWCEDYDGTRFFIIIDKSLTEPFKAYKLDGTQLTIAYASGQQSDIRTYIKAGSTLAQDSYTWVYFANQLMIANRDVTTAVSGSAQNYQYSGTAVRNSANAHHCPAVDDPTKPFALPPAASGQYWYTDSSSVGFPSGFYISQNHTGVGPWYARVQCQEANSLLSPTTMPIVCDLSGTTLTFSKVTWTPRYSGSSLTNPAPTFIGKTIQTLAYHRGRLFICADDRITASKVNEPYNFWLNDFSNVVDDDIIDIGLPAGAGKVQQVGSFSRALVIFSSESRQYQIRADNALTPAGVYLIPTTGYSCNAICNPSIIGNHLYFASNRGVCSQVRDYFYSFDANSNIAPDISAHVQGYIPTDIGKISVSPPNDILVAASRDQLGSLYVYQSYFTLTQRIQAAWFRWTFQNAEVISHEAFDGVLYIFFLRDGKYYLESIQLHAPLIQDTALGFHTHYDRRVSLDGTYDSGNNETTWTVPYESDAITEVILGTDFDSRIGRRVTVVPTVGTGTTTLTVTGRYDQGTVWTGQTYQMNVQLSKQFVRDDNQGVIMGALHLLMMKLDHRNTGGYDVRITPKNRSMKSWRFSPMAVGTTILGQIVIQDYGAFYCKPFCSATDTTIQIFSDTPLPCTINDVQFGCRFVKGKAAI